jgi:3-carboxy-cis,cis-muconate cycloisomerase
MQAAPPITFGLKAAGWLGSVREGREQLEAAFDGAVMLQFGGATGTLAALGKNGIAVANALTRRLGLKVPEAPWHTRRERLGALVCACGLVTATLGKMARDVSLLMQNEVAEATEAGGDGRGGSSTMPHKQNPIACSLALASATRVPGLVASFLSAMVQEHERGVGGWQAEWQIVASVVQSLALAAESMAEVAEGLTIDRKKMQANIRSTQGAVFAERAAMALAPRVGRSMAQKMLKNASLRSARQKKSLSQVLAETPEVVEHLVPALLRDLENPEAYLGSAKQFRRALILGTSPNAAAKGARSRQKIRSSKKER